MSTLILPSQYTHQAREKVEVDYSNPLAKDLIAAYNLTSFGSRYIKDSSAFGVYNGRKSSVGKYPYTLHGYFNNGTSEVPVVYSSEGQVLDFNGTSSRRAASSAFPTTAAGGVVRTYITRVYLRDTTAKQIILGHFNSGLTPLHLYGSGLYVESGTLYGVGAFNNSKIITAPAPSTDAWVTLALVTGVTDGRIYIDGQQVASGDLVSTGVAYAFAIGCSGSTAYDAGGGAAFLNGMVGATLVYSRALVESEIQRLSTNPYQVLRSEKKPWLDVVASGGDGSGSGDIASIALTTPTGASTGSAIAAGDIAVISLSSVLGSASADSSGNASGNIAQIDIIVPIGASSGDASVSAGLIAITLSSPSGTATGGTGVSASGSFVSVTFSSPTAAASGIATASGSIFTTTLSAPQGNASSGSSATGSGSIAQTTLSVLSGIGSGDVNISGGIADSTLTSVSGIANAEANAFGSVPNVSLSIVSGGASSLDSIIASGSIANTQLVAVTGYVYASSTVTSNIDSIVFTAPNGNAIGTGGASSVRVISIKLQKQNRTINVSKQDRTIIL